MLNHFYLSQHCTTWEQGLSAECFRVDFIETTNRRRKRVSTRNCLPFLPRTHNLNPTLPNKRLTLKKATEKYQIMEMQLTATKLSHQKERAKCEKVSRSHTHKTPKKSFLEAESTETLPSRFQFRSCEVANKLGHSTLCSVKGKQSLLLKLWNV